jgi:type II secretory pathway pseudopilin PulG
MAVKVFCCYAREDEALLNKLKAHLRPLEREGLIELWHDRDISAGTEWEREIDTHLNTAGIILLLVSPDFMNSDYCYGVEMKRALERHERGEARVIPIILRPVLWEDAPFSKLQTLPKGAKHVVTAYLYTIDHALVDVAEGIRQAMKQVTTQSEAPVTGSNSQKPEKTALEPKPSSSMATIKPGLSSSSPILYIGLVVLIIAVIVGSAGIIVANRIASDKARTSSLAATATAQSIATATATATPAPYPPTNGKLVLDDPLTRPYQWDVHPTGSAGGSCQFSNGAYHVSESKTSLFYSCSESTDYSNFAFEVQMTIIHGDCGGIAFRVDVTGTKYYYFQVCESGSYGLYAYLGNPQKTLVNNEPSPAITTGLNQLNTIAVVANRSMLDLYVNHQKIAGISDSTDTSTGYITLVADALNSSTEVAFSNAKVWTL